MYCGRGDKKGGPRPQSHFKRNGVQKEEERHFENSRIVDFKSMGK